MSTADATVLPRDPVIVENSPAALAVSTDSPHAAPVSETDRIVALDAVRALPYSAYC
jgi:hypothetical protein